MSSPQGGSQDNETPRVVIRDKRRIDPTSGAVRAPAGQQPAGAPPGDIRGEQMTEQETAAPSGATAPAAGGGGGLQDLAAQLAEVMYRQQQAGGGEAGGAAPGGAAGQPSGGASDEVIDAEYVEK